MSIVAVFGLLSVNPCARAKGALCVHGGSPSGCRPASRPAPAHCFPGLPSAGACHRDTYSILPAARAGSQCQRLRHPAGLPAHAMSCPHVHSVSEALLSLLPALFDSPPAPCSDSAAGHHWPAPDTARRCKGSKRSRDTPAKHTSSGACVSRCRVSSLSPHCPANDAHWHATTHCIQWLAAHINATMMHGSGTRTVAFVVSTGTNPNSPTCTT